MSQDLKEEAIWQAREKIFQAEDQQERISRWEHDSMLVKWQRSKRKPVWLLRNTEGKHGEEQGWQSCRSLAGHVKKSCLILKAKSGP